MRNYQSTVVRPNVRELTDENFLSMARNLLPSLHNLDNIITDYVNGKFQEQNTNLSLGTTTGISLEIISSTGNNVTLPQATSTFAGLLSNTDKNYIDNLSLTTLNNGASLIGVHDSAGNYTGTNVEEVLTEISTLINGLTFTSITDIDLKTTGTPNEYVVEIDWTDSNGTPQTTIDSTPITIPDFIVEDNVTSVSTINALSANQGRIIRNSQVSRVNSLGISINANNFGTFTGSLLSDNQNLKNLLQEIETYLETSVSTFYETTFVSGDWTVGTPNTLTIPATTHGLGTSGVFNVSVYDSAGVLAFLGVNIASGDVTLEIDSAVFDGSVIISK